MIYLEISVKMMSFLEIDTNIAYIAYQHLDLLVASVTHLVLAPQN